MEEPTLDFYISRKDKKRTIHVNTPTDWPENEDGPIVRIILNDDFEDPIFDNTSEETE